MIIILFCAVISTYIMAAIVERKNVEEKYFTILKTISSNILDENEIKGKTPEGNRLFRAEMMALHFKIEKLLKR